MTKTIRTPRGTVEYERAGDGPPVLFVHGTPGGSDTSMAMGRFLVNAGFELFAPSRPGYMGTRLGANRTVDEQAELLAEFMSALGQERFAVVAWSGGGPSSYRLAIRHPDRVSALVPFACVSGHYEPPKENLETRLLYRTGFGHWMMRFMEQHMPESTVKATLGEEGDLSRSELKAQVAEVIGDPEQAAVPLALAEVLADFKHREEGFDNDWKQFAAIHSLDLHWIQCPTLVVVGDADADVDPAESDRAAREIRDATELVIEKGTHLALFAHPDAAAAQAKVVEFLRSHG